MSPAGPDTGEYRATSGRAQDEMMKEIDPEEASEVKSLNDKGSPVVNEAVWYWRPEVVLPLWLVPLALGVVIWGSFRDKNVELENSDCTEFRKNLADKEQCV